MNLSPRNWRPVHLLAAWGTYWAGLIGVKLGPGIAALVRMQAPAAKGSASVEFNNTDFTARVLEGTKTVWEGQATLGTIALWVTVPPLLMWGLWMLMRPPRDVAMLGASDDTTRRVLGEGMAIPIDVERHGEGERGRRITPDPVRITPPR